MAQWNLLQAGVLAFSLVLFAHWVLAECDQEVFSWLSSPVVGVGALALLVFAWWLFFLASGGAWPLEFEWGETDERFVSNVLALLPAVPYAAWTALSLIVGR